MSEGAGVSNRPEGDARPMTLSDDCLAGWDAYRAAQKVLTKEVDILHREIYRAGFEDAVALLALPSAEEVSQRVSEVVADFTSHYLNG